MKRTLTVLAIAGISLISSAQQTGDFQLSVTFNELDYMFTRDLYFHVPTDYDSTQSYKLVVGFRGGPHTNAGQFRDQLSFFSDSIGAIILCPENSGHFWNQEGLTKQLFNYSLDTTLALYNIDTNFIYLTGLSYGGRHSVIVSMDTDNGAIPNLRGVIPFAAGSDSHLEPNYGDISDFPPACICIGLNDSPTFINVSNTLHNDIQTNGGNSILNEIPGVGHTVEFSSYPDEMMECLNYIESTYSTSNLDEPSLFKFNLFPNPTENSLTLVYPESTIPTRIFLSDPMGKLIEEFDSSKTTFSLTNFASGNYFITVIAGLDRETKSLIVK